MKKLCSFKSIFSGLFLAALASSTSFAVETPQAAATVKAPTTTGTASTGVIEARLAQMNIILPTMAPSMANFLPYTIAGKLVFISGQLPMKEGKLIYAGKIGDNISEDRARQATELAALNVLAQLKAAVGDLDKVKRAVKLTGFFNATPDYTNHPKIMNAASDLVIKVLGEEGKHARVALGVASLPAGAVVEIDAIFELK